MIGETENLDKLDSWYKNGTRRTESEIQIEPPVNGGLTCIQQFDKTTDIYSAMYKPPTKSQAKCGPIDAVCTTDLTKLYP